MKIRNHDLVFHKGILRKPFNAIKRAIGMDVPAREPRSALQDALPVSFRKRPAPQNPAPPPLLPVVASTGWQLGDVNVGSDAGVVGNAGCAVYCASKGGLVLMSKSLALELAPFGVRVNAVCPSDIATPMLRRQAELFGGVDPRGYLDGLLSRYPQRDDARFIAPEEVACLIAFLLSPPATPITGAALSMDFGVSAGY